MLKFLSIVFGLIYLSPIVIFPIVYVITSIRRHDWRLVGDDLEESKL